MSKRRRLVRRPSRTRAHVRCGARNPKETAMRFMLIMIPGVTDDRWEPTAEDVEAMTKYNEELTKAGILLSLDGLHPTSKGARVAFPGGKATVTDGPFTESKELIGGYWIIQAK